jgi:hypothetical protein
MDLGRIVRGELAPRSKWNVQQLTSLTFRSEIQQAFTPTTFFNQVQTPRLKAGDMRMHTALKVFVEFSEGATLRIPTREASKARRPSFALPSRVS